MKTTRIASTLGALFLAAVSAQAALNLTEIKKLQPGEVSDRFGVFLALGGDTAVVGAHLADTGATDAGAAYVFQRNEGGRNNWGLVKKLQVDNPPVGARFGVPSISGDTIVVGEFGFSSMGAAYIFQRNQGGEDDWGLVKKLRSPEPEVEDEFGIAVAISGDIAMVGSDLEDTAGTDSGAVYVFQRNQGGTDNWGLVKRLQPADAEEGDSFGRRVVVRGDTAVVSAPGESTGGFGAGAAYVFRRNKGGKNNWGQAKKLQASVPKAEASFGNALGLSGDTLVIGAPRESNDAGAAYIFERNEGGKNNWGLIKKLEAGDRQAGAWFGQVAISADIVVVGAFRENSAGFDSGAAYVFQRDEGGKSNWGQVQKLQPSDQQAEAKIGHGVAISGTTVLVARDPAFPTAPDNLGAVHVFSTPGESDASGDAPAPIDSILADSSQDDGEFVCTLAIASGDQGLVKKSRFRCHIGFGNLGFSANTTLFYQVKKTKRRCKGIPSLVCSEEEIDHDGNTDTSCDGDVEGDPAAACIITLRGDAQEVTNRWLAACTGNDCLTPFPNTGSLHEYDVYTFWSTKRKKKLDRVPDTNDNQAPDSIDEVVATTFED